MGKRGNAVAIFMLCFSFILSHQDLRKCTMCNYEKNTMAAIYWWIEKEHSNIIFFSSRIQIYAQCTPKVNVLIESSEVIYRRSYLVELYDRLSYGFALGLQRHCSSHQFRNCCCYCTRDSRCDHIWLGFGRFCKAFTPENANYIVILQLTQTKLLSTFFLTIVSYYILEQGQITFSLLTLLLCSPQSELHHRCESFSQNPTLL